jgi:hypothetical protein
VAQIPTQPIEFPHHQRVAGLQRLQASHQTRPGVVAPAGQIFVNTLRRDPGL